MSNKMQQPMMQGGGAGMSPMHNGMPDDQSMMMHAPMAPPQQQGGMGQMGPMMGQMGPNNFMRRGGMGLNGMGQNPFLTSPSQGMPAMGAPAAPSLPSWF
jgi:hypothetical protein